MNLLIMQSLQTLYILLLNSKYYLYSAEYVTVSSETNICHFNLKQFNKL
jgi:hypothetical protein